MKPILFSLLCLAFFASCKKSDSETGLPGPSSNGQNYLACTINSKPYVFKGRIVGLSPEGVGYGYFITNDIWDNLIRAYTVTGQDLTNQFAQVYVSLLSDTSSRFPLNTRISFQELRRQEVYVMLESPEDFSDKYYYADPATGWIKLTRADSIGAGTFGFTAFVMGKDGQKTTDSVVVADGRFDIGG